MRPNSYCSILILCVFIAVIAGCSDKPTADCPEKSDPAVIQPDYCNVTIPPNIAPLNFKIQESAEAYYVKVFSDSDMGFNIACKDPTISFPVKKWKNFLAANAGSNIYFEIYIKQKN